jgi:LacI family transcriptional regulator
MRKRVITIRDAAAQSGVHESTVSRALNSETRDIASKPVADKVLAVTRELGYLRKPLASGLRTRRSLTIRNVIPDLVNPVFPPIIRGIEHTPAPAGYVAVLADAGKDGTTHRQAPHDGRCSSSFSLLSSANGCSVERTESRVTQAADTV